jgi:hypothetical protein
MDSSRSEYPGAIDAQTIAGRTAQGLPSRAIFGKSRPMAFPPRNEWGLPTPRTRPQAGRPRNGDRTGVVLSRGGCQCRG